MRKILLALILSVPAFALDFTITTPTAGWPNVVTPSRAITITVTGGTPGSNVSCALTDGGAGGTFYPASPAIVVAPATTAAFVYTPASAGSASITLQAVCTGGLSATHTITQSQSAGSVATSDTFAGTVNTALENHHTAQGGSWTKLSPNGFLATLSLTGTSGVYINGTGDLANEYYVNQNPTLSTDYDVVQNFQNFDNQNVYPTVMAQTSTTVSGTFNGYFLLFDGSVQKWTLRKYVANAFTIFWSGAGPGAGTGTYNGRLAIRTILGSQYVFAYGNNSLLHAPTQDNSLTSGVAGTFDEIGAGVTQTPTTGTIIKDFSTNNADWGSTPVTYTFPNASIFQSPYNWVNSGGTALCNIGGCYMKFQVTGTTSISANWNVSGNSGITNNYMPAVKALVSTSSLSGTYSWSQPADTGGTNVNVSIATGLSTGTTYQVSLYFNGGYQGGGNGWTSNIMATLLNSLQFDNGATLSAYPSLKTNSCIFYGDSYLQYFGATVTGPTYNYQDASQAWPFLASSENGLNCEYMQFGVDGSGWVNTSGVGSGFPIFGSWWNQINSTTSITFGSSPKYVFAALGVNDHGQTAATITSNVSSWITAARSAFGTGTQIFIVAPLRNNAASSGTVNAAIQAGIAAAGDPGTHWIPMGTDFSTAVFAPSDTCTGSPTWMSLDDCHPLAQYHGIISSAVTKAVQGILAGGAAPVTAQ